MIRTNAAMRTLEARLEANLKAEQFTGTTEVLNRRVRHLEGELLEKNRAHAELTQTFNQFLSAGGSENRHGSGKSSFSARSGQTMASRVARLTTRIASLTDKLRSVEDARDHKSRSLDVLMQAFPFLLQRLDALQDRFAAAVESNDILKSALQQMQEPVGTATSNWTSRNEESIHVLCRESGEALEHMTAAMYLHLARDKYLLGAPYPVELLAETTGAQAFSDHRLDATTQSASRTNKKKFAPFRAVTGSVKSRDRLMETENGDGHPAEELVLLAADTSDVSGASYLNRSKINAFLEVAQSRAARRKFKSLVIGKLAECLTKLRELSHRSAAEASMRLASVQMLQREVDDLKQKLQASQSHQSEDNQDGTAATSRLTSAHNKRRLLLKVVDVYAEKQQEQQQQHHQSTFLTQPLSSDVLISNTHTEQHPNASGFVSEDGLQLSGCELDDDDVRQLMLKLLVTSARFRELRLDANRLTDIGAQHVADFLEKCPVSLRVLSLTDNTQLTAEGVELIRRALVRNQRIHRVEDVDVEAGKQAALVGLAVQQAFDESGGATEILRVVLPSRTQKQQERVEVDGVQLATTEAVDAMTEKLRQLGFTYKARRPPTSSRPRSAPTIGSKRRVSASSTRPGTASRTRPAVPSRHTAVSSSGSSVSTRRQIKKQQELRFQTLEAAIRQASAPRSRQHVSTSLTQAPSSQSQPSRLGGSRRRTPGQAHIDMVRGLRR